MWYDITFLVDYLIERRTLEIKIQYSQKERNLYFEGLGIPIATNISRADVEKVQKAIERMLDDDELIKIMSSIAEYMQKIDEISVSEYKISC